MSSEDTAISTSRIGKSRGTSKTEAVLQSHLDAGRHYEATQLYKTLCLRYNGNAKKEHLVFPTLNKAIRVMADAKEGECANELWKLYLHYKEKKEETPSIATLNEVAELMEAMNTEAFSDEGHISVIVTSLMKWIGTKLTDEAAKRALAHLHDVLAAKYAEAHAYADAHMHGARGDQFEKHAEYLVLWSRDGGDDERDLFLTRSVLQTLCGDSRIAHAQRILEAFCKLYWPTVPISWQSNGDTSASGADANVNDAPPLVNFCHFLLCTLERNAVAVFKALRQRYDPSLKRDAEFSKLLDVIGRKYYQLMPSNAANANPLANMMSALLGGGGGGGGAGGGGAPGGGLASLLAGLGGGSAPPPRQ